VVVEDGTVDDGTPALSRLVGDVDAFASDVWGRCARHWRDRGPFHDLVSTEAIEAMLRRTARRPTFRVVRDGPTVPVADYTRAVHLGGTTVDDVADVERIVGLVAGGATVVVQGLQHTWDPLVELCAALDAETSHRTQANAYLTPARTTALRRHADQHHVLALQVEGTKRWEVDGLGELVMAPGDVLYVPRGTVHAAASQERHSLHVTIGIHARTPRQVLAALVQRLDGAGLDAPLPLGFGEVADDDALRRALESAAAVVGDAVRDVVDGAQGFDDVVAHERDLVARRRAGAAPPGALRSVLDLGAVDDATVVRLRAGVTVRCGEDAVHVVGDRHRLAVPLVAGAALERLAASGELAVRELRGLDEGSRAVLARRLLRDGFAVPVPGPPGSGGPRTGTCPR
jgi:lysine-specific demethylase/histidyl-hydroxylase NO66